MRGRGKWPVIADAIKSWSGTFRLVVLLVVMTLCSLAPVVVVAWLARGHPYEVGVLIHRMLGWFSR